MSRLKKSLNESGLVTVVRQWLKQRSADGLNHGDLSNILNLSDTYVDPSCTQAGIIIGDDTVTAIIARLGKEGKLVPHRMYSYDLKVPPGVTPGIREVQLAIRTCWFETQHKSFLPFRNFFLCLPNWCCQGEQVREEIHLVENVQTLFDRTPVITRDHVVQLEDQCAKAVETEQYELISLRPYYYKLDTGREVTDPVNARSTTLELEGYATLAEHGFVSEVLKVLQELDIKVDSIVTPPGATKHLLGEDIRRKGYLIFELDRQSTVCSYYESGELCSEHRINMGTEIILGHTADQVDTKLSTLRKALRCIPEARLFHEGYKAYRLWPPTSKTESLRTLAFAGRDPSLKIIREAMDHFRKKGLCLGEKIDQVMVVADDYLSGHAIQAVISEEYKHVCIRPGHDWPETAQMLGIPGAWRALGVLSHAYEYGAHRQFAIERYTLPLETRVWAVARRFHHSLAYWIRKKITGVPRFVYNTATAQAGRVVKVLKGGRTP